MFTPSVSVSITDDATVDAWKGHIEIPVPFTSNISADPSTDAWNGSHIHYQVTMLTRPLLVSS